MVLEGPEVKSLRQGKATLVDAFGQFQRDQLFLVGLHIAAYDPANRWNSPPNRPRKLLMHRSELRRLFAKTTQRGLTLVPTRIYFKGSRVKVELALAQGKKTFDKREDLKRRDQKREMERALRAAR
jgi:SsrA-binding protein